MPSTNPSPAASSLRALRLAAGYGTGGEFAATVGIPASSYSRYEQSPGAIPLGKAWLMADSLGTTIDAVVGRASDADTPDPYGARVRALDLPARAVIEEWLDLYEGAGRSRLYPEGR